MSCLRAMPSGVYLTPGRDIQGGKVSVEEPDEGKPNGVLNR